MNVYTTGQMLCQGRYRIERFAGHGGMQEVYRAFDVLFEQPVALKTPLRETGEPRFEESARLSARVSHPNVARTLDYFRDGSRPHLVEEWVAGEDLDRTLVRHGPLDPYVSAHIMHHLASGLAAIHRHQLAHRDLKPSNVMVAESNGEWTLKVSDFGIAKMAGATIDAAARSGTGMTTATTARRALPYLAPEVVDHTRQRDELKADVWAVGAMVWHVLTGQPPFGTDWMAVNRITAGKVPSLPHLVTRSPAFRPLGMELYGIIRACLQDDPAERPDARRLVELCSRLCYPDVKREVGVIQNYRGGTFGFIAPAQGGDDVFFHVESLYAERPPPEMTQVWFGRYRGRPRDRAHPVVPMQGGGR